MELQQMIPTELFQDHLPRVSSRLQHVNGAEGGRVVPAERADSDPCSTGSFPPTQPQGFYRLHPLSRIAGRPKRLCECAA